MTARPGSLCFGHARGATRYFLLDRALSGGDIVQLCASGGSEVAEQVGYASASHFTRDFESHYGATPAAYVRELRARLDATRPPSAR